MFYLCKKIKLIKHALFQRKGGSMRYAVFSLSLCVGLLLTVDAKAILFSQIEKDFVHSPFAEEYKKMGLTNDQS